MSKTLLTAILSLGLLYSACSLTATPGTQAALPHELPPLSILTNGLSYSAETRLEIPSATADIGPMNLRPRVTMTNTTDAPVQIPLDGCAVGLRLYKDPTRQGTPVWDLAQYRESKGANGCGQAPYIVPLTSGMSHEEGVSVPAACVLGDGVAPGHYYFTATLALSGRPVELAAGDGELNYGIDGLAFKAETRVVDIAPRKVEFNVIVTNTTDKRIYFEFGGCSLWIRAYGNRERIDTPAWDERTRPDPEPETGLLPGWCLAYQATRELAPGESTSPKEYHKFVDEPFILGDSLSDGHYYFTATVALNNTTVEVPAGEAVLTRRQDPLPSTRTMPDKLLRYEARTEVITGEAPVLRTVVTVANLSDTPTTAFIDIKCPVLRAYRSKPLRDADFRASNPDWHPADDCRSAMFEFVLNARESREYAYTVEVSRILRKLPAGRYYFAASVTTRGQAIVLSAGEADLGASALVPSPTPVPIGVPVIFELYTHCGIHWAYFDGRWWEADPHLGDGKPPAGWRDPSAVGTMELTTHDRALFRGYGELKAEFKALPATVQKDPSGQCY